jgi:hypothetical protein
MQSSATKELNQLENQIKKLKKKLRQLQQLNERTSSSIIPVFCKKNKDSIIESIYNNNSTDLSFWKEFIQKKIDTDEICIVKTSMDGDCLFNSLSKYIKDKNKKQLRDSIVQFEKSHKKQEIVDLILSDPREIPEYVEYLEDYNLKFETLLPNQKFDIYLQVMNTPGVYGQYLEINSFCELFKLNVIILTNENNIHVQTPSKASKKNIFLFYRENMQHYDVLYVKPEKKTKRQKTEQKQSDSISLHRLIHPQLHRRPNLIR